MKKYLVYIQLLFMICSFPFIYAQEDGDNICFGKYRIIHSKILNEDRTLLVFLPAGYDKSGKDYPVVYQLDGWESLYLRGISSIQRLQEENRMPEVIYVAIANTDRSRDMLPYKTKYHRTAGGADNFIKFLTEEATPFIASNYRTTSYKAIIGFSNSGQFLIYMLATKPESFDSYVACSPAMAWDYDFYRDKLEQLFSQRESMNNFLSLVYGGGEGRSFYGDQHYYDITCVEDLARLCRAKAPKGFGWSLNIIEGGRHVPPASIYEGVKALFPGWEPIPQPEITPSGGFINKNESINIKINSKIGTIHYTLDGSEPTRESRIYSDEIIIKKPLTVKAKVFVDNLDEGKTAIAIFKESQPLKPEINIPTLKNGLMYKYYEDYYWYRLPDFESLTPIDMGLTQKINLNHKKRYEGFAFRFEGYIAIDKSGTYRFYLNSNDESKLLIDGHILIHKEPSFELDEKSGQVVLEGGKHKIEVLYVGPPFRRKLELKCYYEGPGIDKQEIPITILFHSNKFGSR